MEQLKPSDIVRKGNGITEARYKLGVLEQKMINAVAAKIKKNDPPDTVYSLRVQEFCNLLGISTNNKYKELRAIHKRLMSKPFEIIVGDRLIMTPWFTEVVLDYKEGVMEIQINEKLKEHFFELKRNFTSYEIKNVTHLKKSFSIRLYELLKRYSVFRSEKTFELGDLREKLGVDEDTYPAYADFKKRALVATQKELAAKTDISFEFNEIKQGRKVHSIQFIIKNKELREVISDTKPMSAAVKNISDALDTAGLSVKREIIENWESYGEDKVIDLINYSVDSGKDNPIGFVVWAIKNKYTASTFRTSKGREELIPLWLKEQKEEEERILDSKENEKPESEENLEEEQKRLEAVLAKYKRD
ncbi:replication initiation protein [Bacillus cereus group sp. BceL297]|uniref:replication initiation protein n=1 Tax=unclassified Bacillus cereus group TaxID=2750818 RepID=UPI003F22E8A3